MPLRADRAMALLVDEPDEFIRNLLQELAERSLRSAERLRRTFGRFREGDQSGAESHQNTGIKPAAIAKVPKRVTVGADKKQESSEEQGGGGHRKRRKVIGVSEKQSCAVCLEEFKDGLELASMPCSHLFHNNCITSWLKRKPSCPLCRREAVID